MPLFPAGHDKDQAFYSISGPEKRVERSVFTTGEDTVQISLTTKFEGRKLQKKINIKVLNLISSCKHPSKRPLSFFDEKRRIDLSVVKNHFGFDCEKFKELAKTSIFPPLINETTFLFFSYNFFNPANAKIPDPSATNLCFSTNNKKASINS